MTEYRVGALADFPPGTHRVVQVGKRGIGVFNLGGELFALPNLCPHQFGPLAEGKTNGTMICTAETGWKHVWAREGEIVTCPWHGLEFDIRTGRSLASPRLSVRRYTVRVEGEAVYVSTARPRMAGQEG
jgi:nitrite reductase/ring-hydroxylating ferredoxin subunit